MASLTQASLRGLRWSALSQLLAQTAQYGSFILLARLLSPQDFGTVASATIVIGLVAMLNELGLGAAIIQRPDLREAHLNAGFWCNLAVGLTLWAVLTGASGAIAAFFQNPEVGRIVGWLGLSFPLVGLAVVPKALMERHLRFRAIGIIDAATAVTYGTVAISMALGGMGVWSLVAGTLTSYVTQLAGMWLAAGWRPGWRFSRRDARELFSFGVQVLGTRIFSYMGANADAMIVGRLLGPAALGAYSLAYKLVSWPMLKISHVTLRVAYPAFARVQGDDEALRRGYGKLTQTLALVTFPLLAALAILAPELLPLVFGAKWQAAVFPTQVLCFSGAMKAMVCSIGTVFLSKGRPDLELKLNVFGSLKLVVFLLVGVRWGINGVAIALALSSLTGAPLQQFVANRLIGLSAREYLAGLAVPAIATTAMAAVLIAWRLLTLGHGWPGWLMLLGAAPLAIGAYMLAMSALGFNWASLARQLAGRPARA